MVSFLKRHPYSATDPAQEPHEINSLRGFGTSGEMISLSFSISSQQPIENLTLTSSALVSETSVIPSDAISVHIVKVWQQAGIGVFQSTPMSVPELLLKDDRLSIRDGYTRRGRCGHWRHLLRRSQIYKRPSLRLNGEACTALQPGQSKQIWISVKVPHSALPGIYRGSITAQGMGRSQELQLEIEILALKLLEAKQDLFIWYKGTLDCTWPQHLLETDLFRGQLQDIYDHGFRSISLNEFNPEWLQQAVDIAHSIGFNQNVVLIAPDPARFCTVDFRQLTPLYYVSDELDVRGQEFIGNHIKNWQTVKAAGQRAMSSLTTQAFAKRFFDDGDIGSAPDVLSFYLPSNLAYFQARSQFEKLREHEAYYYWHSHMEKPDVHRVLAGLFLWKSKAAGIAPYCYQHLPKAPFSPFNDFDEWEPDFRLSPERRPFKDHMTTYPAKSGSIPTVQWKALADGIYDLRYLTTFNSAIEKAESCCSEQVVGFATSARTRCNRFLDRIQLKGIDILSNTNSSPYLDITSEEYNTFREQLARDSIQLIRLIEMENMPTDVELGKQARKLGS